MAVILNGKKLSEKILRDIRVKIEKSGKKLKLAAVLVGNDENSKIFLRQKEKACRLAGIDFELYQFPQEITKTVLEENIQKIVSRQNHGIIIQLPLPEHIDAQKVLNLIPPEKDADLLSDESRHSKLLPPVLAGILELFREYKIKFRGKNIAVVGRGRLVGRPVSEWLQNHGAKVFIINKKTRGIASITKKADILISGVGKPGLITGDMIKIGAVAVDAAGDVEQKSVAKKASYFTPTPGGVGPMTVAMLLKNLLILNKVLIN